MKAKVIKTGEIVDVYHEPQHGQITNIYKESVLVNSRMWTEDELDFCVNTNKAPEKIYIQPDAQDGWFMVNNLNNTLVEYTRTDAFIEKACKWLEENVERHISADGEYTVYYEEMFEDIRNYMKGE